VERLLLKVEEAAEILGLSRSALYNAINRGEVPTVRLGRSVRVPKVWLQNWISQRITAWEKAAEGLHDG